MIDLKARREKDGLRAEPVGRPGGHGASDPKGARFVRARRYHASALGRTADHDRLAAQLRMIALLDGRVIGVKIDMQDNAPLSLGLFHAVSLTCSRLAVSPTSYRSNGRKQTWYISRELR